MVLVVVADALKARLAPVGLVGLVMSLLVAHLAPARGLPPIRISTRWDMTLVRALTPTPRTQHLSNSVLCNILMVPRMSPKECQAQWFVRNDLPIQSIIILKLVAVVVMVV